MKRFVLFASILLTGILAACGSTTTPAPKANLRVMHASPDAGLLDISLDDKNFLTVFPFKDAIGFNQVDAGKRSIKFATTAVTTGTTTTASVPLLNVSQDLVEGRFYTVIAANNVAAIEPLVIEEDNTEPAAGKLRLRVVHAAPAAPAVDIYISTSADATSIATETATIGNLAFKAAPPALDIAPGEYYVRVTGANSKTILFDSGKATLSTGANLTLVAVEQSGATSPISLVNLTRNYLIPRSEIVDIVAQVRVVHASLDAPAVDAVLEDATKVATALTYSTASAYALTKAGPHTLTITGAGTTTPALVTSTLALTGSTSYSVFVMGLAASPVGVTLLDSLTSPIAGNAKLRIVHASPDTVGLDMFQDDATAAVVTGLPYKSGSGYLSVPAGAHSYKFNLTATTNAALPPQAITLEAGKIYTAVVLGSSVAGAVKPLTLNLITDR